MFVLCVHVIMPTSPNNVDSPYISLLYSKIAPKLTIYGLCKSKKNITIFNLKIVDFCSRKNRNISA